MYYVFQISFLMFVSNITAIGLQVLPINSQPRLVRYVGLVTESNNETSIIRYSTSVPQNYLQFVKHPFSDYVVS